MSYEFSRNDCLKWLSNSGVNPKTGYKIDPKSKNGVYSKLLVQCGKMKLSPDKINPEIRAEIDSIVSSKAVPSTKGSDSSSSSSSTKRSESKDSKGSDSSSSSSGSSSSSSSSGASKTATGLLELPVVKKTTPLWPELDREELLALAGKVLAEDPEAQKRALELHKSYCDEKARMNDIFLEWKKKGELSHDKEVALAGDFLNRFCRCLISLKTKNEVATKALEKQIKETTDEKEKAKLQVKLRNMSGMSFGICQKSVYNSRGLKGVATRGANKIDCDDQQAKAENVIKNVGGNCVRSSF